MTKLTKKGEKGITLATLSVAIIIMFIITSTLIYNITTGSKVRALNNMYQDITKLKDKVDLYYANYNTIPVLDTKYENTAIIYAINPNDNSTYYVVDLEALENLNLTYGKDYDTYKSNPSNQLTDLYIMNERSHSIYYVKGISFDNNIYYTIPEESTKIELNAIASIKNIKVDQNIAVISMNAVDKENGIKQIKLFVNDQEYKTYDYTSNFKEVKTETLNLTLTFGEEYVCYLQITDEEGNIATSDRITLRNLTTIATVKDLQNLATLVNDGTTFSGQTINLINDLDLNGSEDNQWVPIGDYGTDSTHYFSGIFNGNNHTIDNLYINSTNNYQGLFGYVQDGTITGIVIGSNSSISGNANVGGVIGSANNTTMQNCGNNANITALNNNIGGIVGQAINSEIISTYNKGDINGSNGAGGIVGVLGVSTSDNVVKYSYNTGNVIGTYYVGGISGYSADYAKIYNCYNTGAIKSISTTGNYSYLRRNYRKIKGLWASNI